MYGTLSIPLGRVKDGAAAFGTLVVETGRFSDEVNEYVYTYGLRQVLNDAMAEKYELGEGGEKLRRLGDEEIVAKAEKRLQALYEGTLRRRNGAEAEPVDPFEAECHRVAKMRLAASYKPLMRDVPKGTKDRLLFAINRKRAKEGKPETTLAEAVSTLLAHEVIGEAIRRQAEENLAAQDDVLAAVGM